MSNWVSDSKPSPAAKLTLRPSPPRLEAYIAHAITHAPSDDLASLIAVADQIEGLLGDLDVSCRRPDINMHHRKDLDPPDVLHSRERKALCESDFLIALGGHSSSGVGQKTIYAAGQGLPILLLESSEHRFSNMVLGTPTTRVHIPLDGGGEWMLSIRDFVVAKRSWMIDRRNNRLTLSSKLGAKVIYQRGIRGWSRQHLADQLCWDEKRLEAIEDDSIWLSNPNMTQVAHLASVLECGRDYLVDDQQPVKGDQHYVDVYGICLQRDLTLKEHELFQSHLERLERMAACPLSRQEVGATLDDWLRLQREG